MSPNSGSAAIAERCSHGAMRESDKPAWPAEITKSRRECVTPCSQVLKVIGRGANNIRARTACVISVVRCDELVVSGGSGSYRLERRTVGSREAEWTANPRLYRRSGVPVVQ